VGVQVEDTRICVVMVGLPARGKSLIAQKGGHPNTSLGRMMSSGAALYSLTDTRKSSATLVGYP